MKSLQKSNHSGSSGAGYPLVRVFRCSSAEALLLDAIAHKQGIGRSEVIRVAVRHYAETLALPPGCRSKQG